MKQTGEPIVLTVNGNAEMVGQDAKSYQQLLEKIGRFLGVFPRNDSQKNS